jgi:hypothetical protein
VLFGGESQVAGLEEAVRESVESSVELDNVISERRNESRDSFHLRSVHREPYVSESGKRSVDQRLDCAEDALELLRIDCHFIECWPKNPANKASQPVIVRVPNAEEADRVQ